MYKLVVGGYAYYDDEIPANLSITMNAGSSGFSVGNIAAMSISGTVPYHLNLIDHNEQIRLYKRSNNTWSLLYCWFMKDATIYDNSSLSFSGVDVAAFTSNDYSIQYTQKGGVNKGVYSYDTIGTQVSTTIPTTLQTLCGVSVNVTACSSATVNNAAQGNVWATDPDTTQMITCYSTQSIKSTLEEVAKFDGCNYYTRYYVSSSAPDYVDHATLLKVQYSQLVISGEYTPLTVGAAGSTFRQIEIGSSDSNYEFYSTGNEFVRVDKTYHSQFSLKDTMRITSSFMNLQTLGQDHKFHAIDKDSLKPNNCLTIIGRGSGRQFTCQKAKIDELLETGQFLTPMSYLTFSQDTYTGDQFVLTSAQYFLTRDGIYASLSGSARSISDFDYVGSTEKRVRQKMNLNYNYGGTSMTPQGIVFKATADTTRVDQGGDWNG